MAAVTAPGERRSLLGMLARDLGTRARRKGRPSKLAAVIHDHLLTVGALAAAVADAWMQGGPGWGLGVLVPALIVLDYKLQG